MNKHITIAAALLLLGSAFVANAQTDIAVTGTVKDIYGNPLPGVIVSANGKDLYMTDKNGQYAATADKSDELLFTLVGFKPQTVKASSNMDVVLEDDAHALAERINLGYSKVYREDLSDAVSTVSGDLLGKSLHTRLQQTLSGRLPGLTTIENTFEPTYEELSMYVRGLSTVHGGSAGVVIDGIFYESYAHDILYRISPEEVESITLLKDGASQAIFGLRGANGVLVINTRRGTPGKMKLNVNISNTVEQPVDVMHQFDSYDYAVLRNQLGGPAAAQGHEPAAHRPRRLRRIGARAVLHDDERDPPGFLLEHGPGQVQDGQREGAPELPLERGRDGEQLDRSVHEPGRFSGARTHPVCEYGIRRDHLRVHGLHASDGLRPGDPHRA